MTKYLCQVQEIYRVESEVDAAKLIEEAKRDGRFTLLKSSTEYKTTKAKGEIVDEYLVCKATIEFQKEKEADHEFTIHYEE